MKAPQVVSDKSTLLTTVLLFAVANVVKSTMFSPYFKAVVVVDKFFLLFVVLDVVKSTMLSPCFTVWLPEKRAMLFLARVLLIPVERDSCHRLEWSGD
jgi:hypothetical protein